MRCNRHPVSETGLGRWQLPFNIQAIILLIFVSFGTTTSVYVNSSTIYKKVCRSSANGIAHTHGESAEMRYETYRRIYTNCTYINGNLIINFLDGRDDYDMSFLKDIQEVTGYVMMLGNHFSYPGLTNLRVIRGRSVFTPGAGIGSGNDYSLFIANNYKENSATVGLKELRFVSLHEIMLGNVYFYNNNLLCYENTINWDDILTGEGTEPHFKHTESKKSTRECPACHSDCNYKSESHCWGEGPDMCQKLTRVICGKQCDGRCFGRQPNECCHVECAGGCTGPQKTDCYACKNFIDDGMCVRQCPQQFKYENFKWVPNPNMKFAYGTFCVPNCPDHLLASMGACVSDCGLNNIASNGLCIPCNGPCPKSCSGTGSDFLHANNINNFTGCTVINGNMRIIVASLTGDKQRNIPPLRVSQLSVFETVKEINEYLVVQAHSNEFRNLSFFRNLAVISGRNLDNMGMSFQIYNTSLESLGLNSLKSILHGRVLIAENKRLCYVDSINWTSVVGPGRRTAFRQKANRNRTICDAENKVCSKQCSSDGCWGPADNQCWSCAGYRFEDKCVSSCSAFKAVEFNGSKECRRCHEECENSCHGVESSDCDSCKNVKDGPYCKAACPVFKYKDEFGSCQKCNDNCVLNSGCTGPLGVLGPGGCNGCSVVVYEGDPARASRCLPPESNCEIGFYKRYLKPENSTAERHQACFRCHPECTECTGPDLSFCLPTACVHYVEGTKCVTNCSSDYYADESTGRCLKCDSHCLRCVGPTASDCLACRDLKLYRDFDKRGIYSEFNCTDKCPDYMPARIVESVNNVTDSICVSEAYAQAYHGHADNVQIGRIVGISLGSLIIIGIIILIIVYLRRQWARSEENKLRLTARISGLDECEPLTPTSAKPDMAMLRLIKESELRRGNIIGSGAFGTVYKGAWIPEGENVKIPVAIKVLQEGTSPSQNKELLQEARIMASVLHPCCIRVLAVCLTAQMMLVTQLMPLGCLLDYVRKNKMNIGSKALLNWSYQIAKGMKYLEDRGIVHRDLAARNVLVQSPNHVKITDFGLSKLLDFNEEQFQAVGGKMPIKWLALECIQHRIFNHKSDVWSFGVTMWELYTYGQRPYENIRAKDISYLLEKGERLPQPMICTIDVYMIMIKCWMLDAESRPSFRELAEEFAKMARDPGRFLVIPGDKLMRLPNQYYDTKDLLAGSADGPEQVISAEEYLQPFGHSMCNPKISNGPHLEHRYNPEQREQPYNSRVPVRPEMIGPKSEAKYVGMEEPKTNKPDRDAPPVDRERINSRYSCDPCKVFDDRVPNDVFGDPTTAKPSTEMDVLKLPVDENDYLQPNFSSPMTYLDLIDGSDNEESTKEIPMPRTDYLLMPSESGGISNPEYFDDACIVNGVQNNRPVATENQDNQKNSQEPRWGYYNEFDSLNEQKPKANVRSNILTESHV